MGAPEAIVRKVEDMRPVYSARDLMPDGTQSEGSTPLIPCVGGEVGLFIRGQSGDQCYEAFENVVISVVNEYVLGGITREVIAEKEIIYRFNGGHILTVACEQVFGGGKDLTGFVDGTVNPDSSLRAALAMAARADGSSHAFFSQFVHDLRKFHSLSLAEKNSVIGRNYDVVCRRKASDGRSENPRLGPGVGDTKGHVFRVR
jgi:deferrochelatase/peroxidase EfeB